MSERRKGESNVLGSAESPYSKGLMARALTAVGLREDEAYELARRTESDLAQRSEVSVDLDLGLRELERPTFGRHVPGGYLDRVIHDLLSLLFRARGGHTDHHDHGEGRSKRGVPEHPILLVLVPERR